MGHQGDQVTAPPDQWRGHQPGHRAEAPAAEQFDDDPAGFSTEEFDRIYSSYVPPVTNGHARHAGSGSVQAALTGYAPPAAPPASPPREQRSGPRHGRRPGNGQPPQDRRATPDRRSPQETNGYQPPQDHRPGNGQPPQDRRATPDRRSPQATGCQPPRPGGPGSRQQVPGSRQDIPGPRRETPGSRQDVAAPSRERPVSPGEAPAPRAGSTGRGPANGFPPKPGEPGPQYPQPQFAAWNQSSGSASAPADVPAAPVEVSAAFSLASAPTWADTGPAWAGGDAAGTAPPSAGPGGGIALAERPDVRATFTDDDVDSWAASLDDAASLDRAQALVPGDRPPAFAADTDEAETARRSRHDSARRAAGLTRAATAKARKAARRRGRTRRRLMAGVCLPAVAIVATMAYLQNSGGHAAKDTASSSPAATLPGSSPSPSLGTWQHIDTRAGDPTPLALSQLFPAQFAVGSAGYVRTVQAGSTSCASAVFGRRLQAAARKYGCTQVMRASYLDSSQKLMGTIGVLNLADSTGSDKVGVVTGSSQFIAQLTAASGPTHSLTKGTGLEEAEIKGHYLILTWVEFSTLKAPQTARQRAQLKDFSANLISRTANVSLTSRMVTGQPQVP